MSTITVGDANLAETMNLLRSVAATVDLWCNESCELASQSLEVNLVEASYCIHRALNALQ